MCLDPFPARGGYPWGSHTLLLRSVPIWRWLAEYFPIKLQKTCELDPSQSYIFVCHPHGVIGFGTWLNFGMNATGFLEKFPGLRVHLLGASAWFWIPIIREWTMLHGFGNVAKKAVLGMLRRGGSVAINVGGARESLDARPSTFRLQLRQRQGFVRCALSTGAHLVPVISFGENEVYTVYVLPKNSLVRRLQDGITSLTGSTLPLFVGLPWLPLLPRSSPIVTVIGEPIEVEKKDEFTDEDVNALHARYVTRVEALFERYKDECGFGNLVLELPQIGR
jgi:1-acyl-sn-glycerol-3-phosphate acyltransferase